MAEIKNRCPVLVTCVFRNWKVWNRFLSKLLIIWSNDVMLHLALETDQQSFKKKWFESTMARFTNKVNLELKHSTRFNTKIRFYQKLISVWIRFNLTSQIRWVKPRLNHSKRWTVFRLADLTIEVRIFVVIEKISKDNCDCEKTSQTDQKFNFDFFSLW